MTIPGMHTQSPYFDRENGPYSMGNIAMRYGMGLLFPCWVVDYIWTTRYHHYLAGSIIGNIKADVLEHVFGSIPPKTSRHLLSETSPIGPLLRLLLPAIDPGFKQGDIAIQALPDGRL
ncbi:MAG: hypothetical protein CM15mP70_16670 [Pelagibacteraceae bacterium]|nr:MAG: hypothetical protein CM15mP70_16670 [Pelagibacteraceae bacterium]